MSNDLIDPKKAAANLLALANETQANENPGPLLKFSKGKWWCGDDECTGAEYVAHISQLARGWVKFEDGKVVDQRIGKVVDGFTMPEREDLGDTDESKWQTDATGKPRDPWSSQFYLPLENLERGGLVVFVTASKGGANAIGRLCSVAARNVENGRPIVKLNVSSYKHREFGRIETPDLMVVGWDKPSGGNSKSSTVVGFNDEIPF